MSPDERTRIELTQRLADLFGADLGAYLMEVIPPYGWHDIATNSEIERRFGQLEKNLDHRFASLRDGLQVAFMQHTNRILMWTVSTVVIGMSAAIAAIVAVGS
jgi:predicted nucleic acid-binding protein